MKNIISKIGNVHLIGVEKKYKTKIASQALKGLDDAAKVLKYNKPVELAIFDAEFWDVHPKMYMSAHARVYYINIKICLYRKDIDINYTLSTELPLTIQHEFSHVVRYNTVGYPETLLDAIIDEGIACYIEHSIKSDRDIPYIKENKNEKKLMLKAKKLFARKLSSELHNEWFFGTGKLPEWIGYRLGFLIVKNFMENNKVSLDKLCRMNAKEILKQS
jgi:hypothetical protein